MKVLFVATVISHIKAFHEPYMEWFQKQGWEVHVVGNGEEKLQFCDKKYLLPIARSPFKLQNLWAFLQLKKIIKKEQYDIIHCHTPMGSVLTRLAALEARKHGTKVIYTAHGFHFFKGAKLVNWLVYYPLERFLSQFTDILITINQEDYQRAKSFSANKIVHVPGVGVDIDKFNLCNTLKAEENKTSKEKRQKIREDFGIQEKDTMLLTIGELIERKNQEVIIEAIADMEDPNIKYVICGIGPLEKELKQKAAMLEVEKQVVFAGYRSDISEIYHAADIFIFPSKQEGLPMALMEAMASGLPIIASNIRGNKDLIVHKKNGYLLSGKIGSYEKAISLLMKSEKKREDFGKEAKKTIRKYSLNVVKKQMIEIYESCMR